VYDRALEDVRRKFVRLFRSDPPPRIVPPPREPLAPVLDRWVANRFSADEVLVLFRLEHERGEAAVTEWFAEVVLEASADEPATATPLAS
jgi:hypothetical protein